jgi:hypothetical protein
MHIVFYCGRYVLIRSMHALELHKRAGPSDLHISTAMYTFIVDRLVPCKKRLLEFARRHGFKGCACTSSLIGFLPLSTSERVCL